MTDGHVTELRLWNNSLAGDRPTSIGDLEHLKELYLGSNGITGPIPSSIGKCKELVTIVMSSNILTGKTIDPPTIAALSHQALPDPLPEGD